MVRSLAVVACLLAAGCLVPVADESPPDPSGVPALLEPQPPLAGMVIASGELTQDADGFVAVLRPEDGVLLDWTVNYAVEFTHWVPFDGQPGFPEHVQYGAVGRWMPDDGAWEAVATAVDRRCEECRDKPHVEIPVEFTPTDQTLTWRMRYAQEDHAALPFVGVLLAYRMDDGGCPYDRWPLGDWSLDSLCASSRSVGLPLDRHAVTSAARLQDVGPLAAYRWSVDADQAAVEVHFDPSPAFADRKLIVVLETPDGQGGAVAQQVDAEPLVEGGLRIAGMVLPDGAGMSTLLDTRGSFLADDVLHLQWRRLPDDRGEPAPGDVQLTLLWLDTTAWCVLAKHGSTTNGDLHQLPHC